jgi:hypothetical protein
VDLDGVAAGADGRPRMTPLGKVTAEAEGVFILPRWARG